MNRQYGASCTSGTCDFLIIEMDGDADSEGSRGPLDFRVLGSDRGIPSYQHAKFEKLTRAID